MTSAKFVAVEPAAAAADFFADTFFIARTQSAILSSKLKNSFFSFIFFYIHSRDGRFKSVF